MIEETRSGLQRTQFELGAMGFGTWAWGDTGMWGFGNDYDVPDLREAFRAALNSGVFFFDTAELYSMGVAEELLGQFIKEIDAQKRVFIATKFMPLKWRKSPECMLEAINWSLNRLQLKRVGLYQIHRPLSYEDDLMLSEVLATIVEAQLALAVGISNYDANQALHMHELLARRSIPLSFLQVEFNLLHRQPEFNGLLQMCQRMGITLIAYNPLASGLLTGKYSASHPPPGRRGQMYPLSLLVQLEPLIETMRVLGQLHRKTPSQVALNWLIRKGVFPIPGVKTAAQVLENVGACGWFLSDEEMTVLDMLTTPEV